MIDTLIINAHPDPHSTASATNRMVTHLLDKLPAGSVQTVNLAETDIQPLDKAALEMFTVTLFQGQQPNEEQAALQVRLMSVVNQVKSARRLVIAYPMYNPMAQMDFASSYLKTLLGGFLGFASVDTVYAEGTAGDWEAAVQRACAKIDDVYDHFAA